jgi:hypothetical protein
MAYDCCVAQYIRKKVFKEWWFRTTESRWYNHPTFEEAFFSEGTSTFEVLRRPSMTLPLTIYGNSGATSYTERSSSRLW